MIRKTENKIKKLEEKERKEKLTPIEITGEKQRLPITNDYIFKRVFAYKGNESMLKDLLEAILEINIAKVKIKNPEIIPYTKEEKRGLLDIKVELEDGTNIDIEMQMKNKSNTKERSTLYLGKMISEQLLTGDKYTQLKKSIVIFITNYNFIKRNSYHNIGRMRFDEITQDKYVDMGYKKEEELASEYIEIHYIELPKFIKKKKGEKTKLDQWLSVFTGNEEEIKMAEKENQEIKRAVRALDFISLDEKEREIYNSIVMAEYNQQVTEHKMHNLGLKERSKRGRK